MKPLVGAVTPQTGARRAARGFSFVELMMSLALMGILATVALPMARLTHQRHQERELAAALREIRQAIDAYRRAADQGHIAVKAGASGFPPSLEALVDGVVDEKSPTRRRLYFLRQVPRDPMASDAEADASDTWAKRSHESPPDDPREGADVFDVRSRAAGTGLNGIPYRQW